MRHPGFTIMPQYTSMQTTTTTLRSPRILSIQSHVVSGYCGNKAVTFPLQLLGFEMDPLNTVQLSNHTQYKVTKGQIFTGEDLDKLHAGLKENNLLRLYDQIISGYVADEGCVESMAKLISDTKRERTRMGLDCFYVADPVLGDDGLGYYVPNGPLMAEAYKKHLLPLADIITPNRFEASVLSGIEIGQDSAKTLDQAVDAMNVLHKQAGVQIVVITSLQLNGSKNELTCLASHWPAASERRGYDLTNHTNLDGSIWAISVPKLDGVFTGTGDLLTALLTAWLHKTKLDLKKSLENTIGTIQDILEDTLAWSFLIGDSSVQSIELRLIQNCDKIIHPSNKFKATPIKVGRETKSFSNKNPGT
jgi:pyridoxine kinase